MLGINKNNLIKGPFFFLATSIFLVGCEVGSATKGKSPYRAPSSGTSTASPVDTSVEVATPFTVQVTVKDKSGFGIPNITPTITARGATSGTSGVTVNGCTTTDRKGLTTCTLQARLAQPASGELYTISVTSPVQVTAAAKVTVKSIARSLVVSLPVVASVTETTKTSQTAFGAAVTVEIRDKAGSLITSGADAALTDVKLAITTPDGAKFNNTGTIESPSVGASSETANATAVAGVATFAGLTIDKVGTYTFTATATGSAGALSAVSSNYSITVGTATRLVFKVEPSTTAATDVAFAVQPIVSQADAAGNYVSEGGTTDSCVVDLSIDTVASSEDSGDQLLGSSLSLTMTDGLANFGSPSQALKIRRIGTTVGSLDYYIAASPSGTSCPGITGADSTAIQVSLAGMPRRLVVVQPPSTSALNETWVSQPIVAVLDANGTLVGNDTTTRVIMGQPTVSAGTAGQLVGSTTVQVSNGLAVYSGLKIYSTDPAQGNKTYTYAFTGINPPYSIQGVSTTQYVTKNGFTPDALLFRTQPVSMAVNEQSGIIEVKTVDDNGFFCFNDNSSVVQLMYRATDTAGTGTMQQGGFDLGSEFCDGAAAPSCPATNAGIGQVVNGVATFSGLNFTTSGAKRIVAYDASSSGPAELGSTCVSGNAVLCGALSDIFAINNHASDADHLVFQLPDDSDGSKVCDPATPTKNDDPACQPGDDAGPGPWTYQPRVAVVDKYGNLMTSDNSTVITVDCFHEDPCSLLGHTQVKVTNGSARFYDLQMETTDKTGILVNATASPALPITTPAQAESFDQTD